MPAPLPVRGGARCARHVGKCAEEVRVTTRTRVIAGATSLAH